MSHYLDDDYDPPEDFPLDDLSDLDGDQRKLVETLAAHDEAAAAELADKFRCDRDASNRAAEAAYHDGVIERAERAIGEAWDVYRDDPEYGEAAFGEAVANKLRAEDQKLKALDPEAYSEARYFYGSKNGIIGG